MKSNRMLCTTAALAVVAPAEAIIGCPLPFFGQGRLGHRGW